MKPSLRLLALLTAPLAATAVHAPLTTAAYAQARYVFQGTVTDAEGEPLIGATVQLDGRSVGTLTDVDGRYRFEAPASGEVVLVASYLGYSTVRNRIVLGSATDIESNFQLPSDALGLDEVVVTGVVNPASRLESSVSISTLRPENIQQSAPRSTAEIFRTIPGVRSEASGGDGNTNITVRGVPISAGGSKYLQLQEDGLPVFLFGDIAFATSDIFLRADNTLDRIEAIRGGSASTVSSNSPAGIINFVSQTGAVAGGSLGVSSGLTYNSNRVDFGYGSPLGDGLSFFVGGFMRSGHGVRDAGYLAEQGGQVKANLTKVFNNGFVRLHAKYLNDRTPAYMPMALSVTGTNDNPTWGSLPGFSATTGTTHSLYLASNFGIGANGERRRVDVADGMHPVSTSLGMEMEFDLPGGWTLRNKGRFALNSGRFVAPFPATVGSTASVLAAVGTAVNRNLTGASLRYADGGGAFSGSIVQAVHMFDTELQNFNNLFNDASVSRSFGTATVTAGLFKGIQRINMSWLWNSYLMEVKGENARLLDIVTNTNTNISQNGLYAYGVPVWGNCCQVQYNATYDVTAPYANLNVKATPQLTVDASVRYDMGDVSGVGMGGKQGRVDVNNDGVIQPAEESVSVIDQTSRNPVNYGYDGFSYSAGANYAIGDDIAVFARASHGFSAKADRAIFPSGSYTDASKFGTMDEIDQVEVGYKQQFRNGGLFVTGFYASTTEQGGFEASTQKIIDNDYRAFGLEVEGSVQYQMFNVRGMTTLTSAEITSGDNEGNTPRRQPTVMFSLIPSARFGMHSAGLSLLGQTQAYTQDSNELVMPGYVLVNGFVDLGITRGLVFNVSANNLLDTIGITEAEEGALAGTGTNYIRGRSVLGRSVSAGLRYRF